MKILIGGELFEEHAPGDGQYDAFMNATEENLLKRKKQELPVLTDMPCVSHPAAKAMPSAKRSSPGATTTRNLLQEVLIATKPFRHKASRRC